MISPWEEEQYIEEVGKSIEGFRKVRDGVYNCRCPICGDSATNWTRRRGYFILHGAEGGWSYYCHNCGASYSIRNFLKTVDESLYQRYCIQDIKSRKTLSFKPVKKKADPEIESAAEQKFTKHPLLQNCANLSEDHPAVQYLLGRGVDRGRLSSVLWTDDFPALVRQGIGSKYANSKLVERGIVFVVRDFSFKPVGWQIRNIEAVDKKMRFSTCTADGFSGELCYVPSKLDRDRTVFVVEGCIDSLFLHNSAARLQAALWKFQVPGLDCIYFNDQEPRNREVCGEIQKCISLGLKTVLLSSEYSGMDVNDIAKGGLGSEQIEALFRRNAWKGLSAKVKFSGWLKGTTSARRGSRSR